MTRIPHHTNQFVHRQQYGSWNWRNDQSQHPDTINGSRYNAYFPQLHLPSYNLPSFSLQRPTMYPRNQRLRNDQQFCDRMLQFSTPVKKPRKIIQYSSVSQTVGAR
ncbi:hypothetical protein TNCV_3743201 [Trichonephila clavipes]|nr:hypothetical protein TNCV_3743201 [Trichonephila clavipes]